MHEAVTRIWKEDDDGPKPCAPETVDPLEAGCARALEPAMKHDCDADYATSAAREYLAKWRFVTEPGAGAKGTPPAPQQHVIKHAEWLGRVSEKARIKTIIRVMITERLRLIGLMADDAVKEIALTLAALQEILDAIDPPNGPMPPRPMAAFEKMAA